MIAACLWLASCSSDNTYAPVIDIATIQHLPASGKQRVERGDTIYQIAFRYGLEYHDIARRNQIAYPYKLHVGQVLYLKGRPPKPPVHHLALVQTQFMPVQQHTVKHPDMSKEWVWPAHGKVVRGYAGLNKGINIASRFGSPIYAANSGVVVYSGHGLRGYGNLIIIKHNSSYMSAYAHNSVILVKEDDVVKKGQKIAEMGSSGTNNVMLHFEIRRNGDPVNPVSILKS